MIQAFIITLREGVEAALVVCLALPADAKTVRCADGTTSKAGRGGCSRRHQLLAERQ